MSNLPYYRFFVGDYQQKTAHLTLAEHGAYRLLLDHYYSTRSPLPSDHKLLYRICRVNSRLERRLVDDLMPVFFTLTEQGYRNAKCDEEIARMLKYSDSQSARAQLRHSRGTTGAPPPARVVSTSVISSEAKASSDKRTRTSVTIEELSTDHIAEWLAIKRAQGKYQNHDEKFVLEYFKNYCQSKGKKYANPIAALRNAFEWDACQPKPDKRGWRTRQLAAIFEAGGPHSGAQPGEGIGADQDSGRVGPVDRRGPPSAYEIITGNAT